VSLLFASGGFTLLTLGLGCGRGAFGSQMGFMYYLLAIPLLCCIYFAWLFPTSGGVGRLVQICLFLGVLYADALNAPERLAAARAEHATRAAFERDLQGGVPPYRLIAQYRIRSAHNPASTDAVVGCGALDGAEGLEKGVDFLQMLRRARIGSFGGLSADPAFRAVSVPLEPIELGEVDWDQGTGRALRDDSFLTFALPRPMYVAALRIQCRAPRDPGPVALFVAWKGRSLHDPTAPPFCTATFPLEAVTIAVDDNVEKIYLYPNALNTPGSHPFEFQVTSVEALIPAKQSLAGGQSPPGLIDD
jgi:hypothetical protein